MSSVAMVGWSAVGVLVLGLLVVTFSAPSPRRTVIEWLSACSMSVALISLFTSFVLRAQAADNTLAMVAFGALGVMFCCGLLVSAYQMVSAMGGGGSQTVDATH